MSCCLCRNQDAIETFSNTIKLDCSKECLPNIFDDEKEELWETMQDDVKKVLKTRKLNATNILNIIPEKPEHHNVTLSLLVTHGHTHLGIHFHKHTPDILKSVSGLSKLAPDEYVDVKWSDKNELDKLYKLTNLLQVALKAKLAENEEEIQDLEIQKELPVEISDYGNIILSNKSHRKRLKSHLKRVKRDHWFGKNPREKELFFRFRKNVEFPKATGKPTGEQGKLVLCTTAEKREKLARELELQKAVSLNRFLQTVLHSLQNHSISNLPTKMPLLTASIVVKVGAEDSETLNKHLPDITLSHETHWKHHKQTTSALPSRDTVDKLLQKELYEVELNKVLASIFPSESEAHLRKLFFRLIPIMNMDCSEPNIQMACNKLFSTLNLLLKDFNVKPSQETPVLWNSYFWPTKNINDMITASSRKMEKPSDEIARQRIPEFEYYQKLLLGILVAIMMAMVALILLITYLGNRRRGTKGSSKKVSSGEEEGGEENLSFYDHI
ncbi:uncharacterized protein LOC131198917 isoform X2 [Ahaetulla prasina]|nr:uncharacterized protein LOC131198917 isoform X2 [Ahaetulla prasina]